MSRPPPDPIYILRGGGTPITVVEFSTLGGNEQRLLSGYGDDGTLVWNEEW
jgi:hypothetical protein